MNANQVNPSPRAPYADTNHPNTDERPTHRRAPNFDTMPPKKKAALPPAAAPPPETAANRELRAAPRQQVLDTLGRLRKGYHKAGNRVLPALRAPNGCLVGRKAVNRSENGYMHIPLVRERNRGAKKKTAPQIAGRLVAAAKRDTDQVNELMAPGGQASQLVTRHDVCQ